MRIPFKLALGKAYQRLTICYESKNMELLKIEATPVGVDTTLQELAYTEIPVSKYFFFC